MDQSAHLGGCLPSRAVCLVALAADGVIAGQHRGGRVLTMARYTTRHAHLGKCGLMRAVPIQTLEQYMAGAADGRYGGDLRRRCSVVAVAGRAAWRGKIAPFRYGFPVNTCLVLRKLTRSHIVLGHALCIGVAPAASLRQIQRMDR